MIDKFQPGDRARLFNNSSMPAEMTEGSLHYVFAVQTVNESIQFIFIDDHARSRSWPSYRFERVVPASQRTL